MENITLEKINFENGSSGNTPLNKTNLNQMQQNTENAINEVVPIITGIEENTENNNSDIAEAKINIANNTNNILEINNFIENSMKTLSAEGTFIHVADSADYPCALEIEGKSEQLQTEQSANLCPNINSDKWVLSGGAYKENGYIVLPQSGAKAEMDVEWNGQVAEDDGFFKCYWGANMVTEDAENAKYLVETIYLNENKQTITSNGNGASIGATDIWKNWHFSYADTSSYGQAIRDAKYIRYRISYGSTNTAPYKFKDPMISKTSCSTYIPFTPDSPSPDYPSKIENVSGDLLVKVVGKNLVTLDDLIKVGNANVIKENGKYLIQSNSANPVKLSLEDLKLTNDYTIRFKIQALSNFEQFINFSNALNGSEHLHIHGSAIVNETIKLFTARFTTNELYIYVGTSASATNFQFYLSDFEIVEGSYTAETMPEFEEYKEQTVTFPLGTQKLYKDGYLGDDGIHNKRKQIVLDGTETYISEVLGSVYLYEIEKNDMLFSNAGKGLCSHFINYTNNYSTRIGNIRFGWNNKKIYFYTSFPTLEEFKAWLAEQYSAGTPVIVEYELEEEETTPYTEEQATAKKQIDSLKTYRTVTNISNNQDTNMKLTYKKDLQTQFQELEALVLESGV